MATQPLTIALAGNPNVGKSTIFNALTGSRQHVGNWPGKTVEKKEGRLRLDGLDVVVVDLPGTYSLTAYSAEEIISRDFIIHERPDAVIAVVDAANLERNLYLVTQVFELEAPVILVLNMADVARSRGLIIDVAELSAQLNGAAVIETVGHSGVGVDALRTAIRRATSAGAGQPLRIAYDPALEREIGLLTAAIETEPILTARYRSRWLAVRLLEGDADVAARLVDHADLLASAAAGAARIEAETGDDAETLVTDGRYAFIQSVASRALTRPYASSETTSDKIDRLLTHRLWGLPIFLLLMWVVFQVTANASAPLLDWVDAVITGPITRWAAALFGAAGLGDTWIESLAIDGALAGVGGVLAFVPVLLFLYLSIGILEDSGYMARAAFVMDRVMRTLGLHGKSFLPMLVGFGCNVPAIYATRTLENADDRRMTGFLVTFMSCGARLPVYVVVGAAFFGAQAGHLIFGMYLLGVGVALVTGWMLRRTVFRNRPPQPFVMELPPYRAPRLRDVWRQTWERTSGFVRKAATLILAVSVILWLLMAIPVRGGQFNQIAVEDSVFGAVSQGITPVFSVAGFGTWQASGSLIMGVVAKEIIIGTMSQIFVGEAEDAPLDDAPPMLGKDVAQIGASFAEALVLTGQELVNIVPRTLNIVPAVHLPEADLLNRGEAADDATALQSALTKVFSPLAAVAFTAFVLLYTPCMATIAAARHEFGGRFAALQIAYTFAAALLVAAIIYQGGTLLGWGG